MKDFIVFEGPDMCGKSTHIDTVIDKIRQKTGKVFAHLKFPDYNGFKGNEILDHLKNFNVAKEPTVDSALQTLLTHAYNLMVNKFDNFTKLDTTKYACDGFIVDRFDMSQLIYDIAWCKYFEHAPAELDTWSNEKSLNRFYTNAVYRTKLVHDYFSSEFNIKYVLFKKSEIIEHAVKKDTDRRIDNYDTNTFYQKIVSDLFNIIGAVTFNDQSLYNYTFNKFKISGHVSVFKADDIICKVDTDEIYNNLISTDPVSVQICKADTDEIYNAVPVQRCSQDGLDKLLERKDEVTSIIDDNIVQSIIDYLKEKENINER